MTLKRYYHLQISGVDKNIWGQKLQSVENL